MNPRFHLFIYLFIFLRFISNRFEKGKETKSVEGIFPLYWILFFLFFLEKIVNIHFIKWSIKCCQIDENQQLLVNRHCCYMRLAISCHYKWSRNKWSSKMLQLLNYLLCFANENWKCNILNMQKFWTLMNRFWNGYFTNIENIY